MKVGDYVRTEKGISKITTVQDEQIRKIIYTDTEEVFEYYTDYKGNEIKDYWLNFSSNIIDLIELGDYVNGAKVIRFKIDENETKWLYTNDENSYGYKSDEIKSIVTKEQFSSMEYRINE